MGCVTVTNHLGLARPIPVASPSTKKPPGDDRRERKTKLRVDGWGVVTRRRRLKALKGAGHEIWSVLSTAFGNV